MSPGPSDGKPSPIETSGDETLPRGARISVPAGAAGRPRLTIEVHPRHGVPPLRVPMHGDGLTIGREEGDIRIEDLLVSRRHAAIEIDADGVPFLRDLDSTNGTFLNGALLIAPARLRDGDDIRIGPAHLLIRIAAD
jgi:hypothetical protein